MMRYALCLLALALTGCRAPVAPVTCTVTGESTHYIYSATGDSLPVTIRTEWCE